MSSKPALLQADQAQLSQPVIHSRGALALKASLWPPLDSLQQLHMLVTLGVPDLKVKLQVGSQESRIEEENPLPLSAAHTAGEEPQDTGVSGLPAHMASLWPSFYPPLPPGPCQQGWSQSVCPLGCIDMGVAGIQSWGACAASTTSNKYPGNHSAERSP